MNKVTAYIKVIFVFYGYCTRGGSALELFTEYLQKKNVTFRNSSGTKKIMRVDSNDIC